MECILGIKFNEFVIVACDTANISSIIVMKRDADKMYQLSDKLMMLVCGDDGDKIQFAEYISKNIQLYKMRNGYELSPYAAAHFTRKNLADALRSRNPYATNMLLAGYDDVKGPKLYYLDYLATLVEVPFAAHGYSGYFTLSTLDRYYKPDMNREQAFQLVKACVEELQKRFLINYPAFRIRMIDSNGITDLETIRIKPDRTT